MTVTTTNAGALDVDGASAKPAAAPTLRQFAALVAIADLAVLSGAAFLGWQLRHLFNGYFDYRADGTVMLAQAAVIVGLWFLVLVLQRAYSRDVFSSGYGAYPVLARASIVALGCIGFFAYFTKTYIPRGFLGFTIAVGLPALFVVRWLAHQALSALRTRGYLRHRAIVVGTPSSVTELLGIFGRELWTGYSVVGVCVPEDSHDAWSHDVPVLGVLSELADVVRQEDADTVVVAGGSYSSSSDLRKVAWELEGQTVDLLVAPALTDVAGPRIRMRNVAGLPLVHVAEPALGRARGPLKRIFDLTGAAFLLLLTSPVLLAVAVAVKLQDGGPVFYRQSRIGALGRRFSIIKFRSMVPDADEIRVQLIEQNEHDSVLFKMRRDPRITPVGRFLRRYSIDELPQLLNVIKGDMSLVGPRPALPDEVEGYETDMRRRLLVQPGLTGLWQVSGRSNLSWEDTVRLDLYYVDNWSMVGDLAILAKTARAVLTSNGAY